LDQDILVYKNSDYKFKVTGEDANYHPIDFSNKIIKWSADSLIGNISSQGVITAGSNPGIGKVTAEVDGVKSSSNVIVVDKIHSLNLQASGTLNMNYDDTYSFKPIAKTENGRLISINQNAIQWSVNGNIGTIDKNGVLKITTKVGSGEVIAEAGGKKVAVKIVVPIPTKILFPNLHP